MIVESDLVGRRCPNTIDHIDLLASPKRLPTARERDAVKSNFAEGATVVLPTIRSDRNGAPYPMNDLNSCEDGAVATDRTYPSGLAGARCSRQCREQHRPTNDDHAPACHEANVTTVRRESHLMTDGPKHYVNTGKEFAAHSSIDHVTGEYAREGFHHSNTVENYFSILKRGITGVYHHVSEAHLGRYLAEFDFRYSYRQGLGVSDAMRADEMLKATSGKRLTYRRTREAAYA